MFTKRLPLFFQAQRRVSFDSQVSAMDALRYSLREQILFHQVISFNRFNV